MVVASPVMQLWETSTQFFILDLIIHLFGAFLGGRGGVDGVGCAPYFFNLLLALLIRTSKTLRGIRSMNITFPLQAFYIYSISLVSFKTVGRIHSLV